MLEILDHELGAERALQFAEEKIGAGSWRWDVKTRRMDWSRGVYALLGLDPDTAEPSLDTIERVMHPLDRRIADEIELGFAGGLLIDRDFRIIRPNGALRWISNRCETLFDADGSPTVAVGVMIDVTGRRLSDEIRRSLTDRFVALAEGSDCIVWTLRGNAGPVVVHAPARCGGSATPMCFTIDDLDAVHPEDRDATEQAWSEMLAEGKPIEIAHRLRGPDGVYETCRSRVTPIRESTGDVLEYLGVTVPGAGRRGAEAGRADVLGVATGAQIRGARGILRWSVRELADAAGLTPAIVRRIESYDGVNGAASRKPRAAIAAALVKAGVELISRSSGLPGVAPRQ